MTTERQSPSGREALRIIDVLAVDFASVPANTAPDQVIAVPGANVGDIVLATPLGVWPNGLTMLPNRVLTDDNVSVRLGNVTVGAVDPVAQSIRFAVFRNLRTGADRNSPNGRVQKLTSDVTFDFANVVARTAVYQAVPVPGALPGDTIIVTPQAAWTGGLVLGGPHQCLVAGTVQTYIGNVTAGDINPASIALRYTLYRNVLHPDRQSPSGRVQRRDIDVAFGALGVAAHTTTVAAFTVPTAQPGDAFIVTPLGVFDAGIVLAPHKCAVAGTVQVVAANMTAGLITVVAQDYRVSVIRP